MGKRGAPFSNRYQHVWFGVLLLGLLLGVGSSGPAEAACGGSPVVVTDKPDYGPTETVVISGTGFNCGEAISVLVTAPDGTTRSDDGTGAAGPDTVVTDDGGAFSLSYHLSGTLADGSAYDGQLGIYRVEVRDGSDTVLAESAFSDAGGSFSCALTTAGGVKCWGANSATPVDMTGLTSGIIQITLGLNHACALTDAGGVKCWGFNGWGQLGNGTFTSSTTPVDVPTLTGGVAQISVGATHTCALMAEDGGVKCWGGNALGELGNGAFTNPITTPEYVRTLTSGSGVARISAAGRHTCALMADGGVKCWGNLSAVPVVVLPRGVAAQISSGGQHICAVTTAGGAMCWGANFWGQLGDGTFTNSTMPVVVKISPGIPLTSVAQISAGQDHTCALMADGGAKCWGDNLRGQVGNGTFTTVPPYPDPLAPPYGGFGITTPVDVLTSLDPVDPLGGVAQISGGLAHTCAVTVDGGVKCWGANQSGQLGNGTFATSATPVDVSGLTSGVAVLWDAAPRVPWTVSGFYHPVEMGGALNTVKGGSTVPIKFQVFAGATELTDSSIVQPLTATQAPCSGGPTDTIELTATGRTSLRYGGGHFIFNWKTPKMPGYCYTITVALTNGASLSANFELR